jgi:hypothetical protein
VVRSMGGPAVGGWWIPAHPVKRNRLYARGFHETSAPPTVLLRCQGMLVMQRGDLVKYLVGAILIGSSAGNQIVVREPVDERPKTQGMRLRNLVVHIHGQNCTQTPRR